MSAWVAVEAEELDIALYSAVREGYLAVQSISPDGEALYDITPLGMTRARAGLAHYGLTESDEATLVALAAGLPEILG